MTPKAEHDWKAFSAAMRRLAEENRAAAVMFSAVLQDNGQLAAAAFVGVPGLEQVTAEQRRMLVQQMRDELDKALAAMQVEDGAGMPKARA